METVVRVDVKNPLTADCLIPKDGEWITELVITRIYAGGARLDEGWKYRWDGIARHVPDIIPRKFRGKKLQAMDVLVNMQDRHTIETIFAVYTGYRVEYGIFVKESDLNVPH